MKGAKFSLNPNAEAYVPVNRRGLTGDNKVNGLTKNGHPDGNQNLKIAEDSKPKGKIVNPFNVSSSSRSQNEVTEKKIIDEEYEMHLAFLSMMFPGLSNDSLADVYEANSFDLESSIDMLNDLENFENESVSFEASGSGPSAGGNLPK